MIVVIFVVFSFFFAFSIDLVFSRLNLRAFCVRLSLCGHNFGPTLRLSVSLSSFLDVVGIVGDPVPVGILTVVSGAGVSIGCLGDSAVSGLGGSVGVVCRVLNLGPSTVHAAAAVVADRGLGGHPGVGAAGAAEAAAAGHHAHVQGIQCGPAGGSEGSGAEDVRPGQPGAEGRRRHSTQGRGVGGVDGDRAHPTGGVASVGRGVAVGAGVTRASCG